MIGLREPQRAHRIPTNPPREDLLAWIRAHAPDLRIRRERLENGKHACAARMTFRGEEILVEAVESDELPDADDAIVRRCAWLIYRRLGMPVALPEVERRRREVEILQAKLRGDDATADKLARELAETNEGLSTRQPVRARFENFGGSMFGREKR